MEHQVKERVGDAVPARAGRATPRAAARLGHTATIDYRGRRGDLLSKALNLLSIQADRLEARGVDVEVTRNFIRNAAKDAWPGTGA